MRITLYLFHLKQAQFSMIHVQGLELCGGSVLCYHGSCSLHTDVVNEATSTFYKCQCNAGYTGTDCNTRGRWVVPNPTYLCWFTHPTNILFYTFVKTDPIIKDNDIILHCTMITLNLSIRWKIIILYNCFINKYSATSYTFSFNFVC